MKFVTQLLIYSVLILSTSCSMLMPQTAADRMTPEQLTALAAADDGSRAACESRLTQELANDLAMMSKMTPDQIYQFMLNQKFSDLAMEVNKTNQMLVAHLTGGSIPNANVCGGSVWDYLAASDESKMDLAVQITKTVGSLGGDLIQYGGWYGIARTVMSNSGMRINTSGDSNSIADIGNTTGVSGESTMLKTNDGGGQKTTNEESNNETITNTNTENPEEE